MPSQRFIGRLISVSPQLSENAFPGGGRARVARLLTVIVVGYRSALKVFLSANADEWYASEQKANQEQEKD